MSGKGTLTAYAVRVRGLGFVDRYVERAAVRRDAAGLVVDVDKSGILWTRAPDSTAVFVTSNPGDARAVARVLEAALATLKPEANGRYKVEVVKQVPVTTFVWEAV